MALLMIASLAGFPMTSQAPLSGAIDGEHIDVPQTHELALRPHETNSDDGGEMREWSAEPPPPLETAQSPLALSLPSLRCARAIGPQPTRRHCSWSARGPPAIST